MSFHLEDLVLLTQEEPLYVEGKEGWSQRKNLDSEVNLAGILALCVISRSLNVSGLSCFI